MYIKLNMLFLGLIREAGSKGPRGAAAPSALIIGDSRCPRESFYRLYIAIECILKRD